MAIINHLNRLLESTYQIQEDVDMVFEIIKNSNFYKKVINLEYMHESSDEALIINSKDLKFKSAECVKANSINSFDLILSLEDSYYSPRNVNGNKSSEIKIAILGGLYNHLVRNLNVRKNENGWCISNRCYETIPELLKANVRQEYAIYEFKEHRAKGTLHHELIHWLDDSLHDMFITKKLLATKNKPYLKPKILYQKHSRPANSPIEINAIIGNIKEIRNSMSREEWDKLSLTSMFALNPSLESILHNGSYEEYNSLKKEVLKRLHREDLLGKNMKNYYEEM